MDDLAGLDCYHRFHLLSVLRANTYDFPRRRVLPGVGLVSNNYRGVGFVNRHFLCP